MKTEDRERHKWGEEDEYGIAECQFCHKLRKRKANSDTRLRRTSKIAWEVWYSNRGTKWTLEHLTCV